MDTSIIINTFMFSCASNVIPQYRQRWRSFFEDPFFVTSPSPPQSLPIYVEMMYFVFAAQSFSFSTHSKSKRYDSLVLDLIDLEAES